MPKKGDTLNIDSLNFYLYGKLIEYETGSKLSIKNDKVYLDNRMLNSYVFQLNYYFMAGDMLFDSQDSRYWGLLPEDHIVGKVSVVWKSENPHTGKIRWDRVMKMVE